MALLAERALLWERTGTLLAADAHLGKAAAFRAAAIPLPGGTTDRGARPAHRGARPHRRPPPAAARRFLPRPLGAGRPHPGGDRGAGASATRIWRSCWCAATTTAAPAIRRASGASTATTSPGSSRRSPSGTIPEAEEPAGYVLAGHIHPAVSLSGPGRQRERLPCFLFGERVGILPAFGDFTGGAAVGPRPGDRVFAVAGDEVVAIGVGCDRAPLSRARAP